MARGGVNKALVQKARLALLARGEHPSIDAVRIEMGNTGSKTTIHRYLKELDQGEVEPPQINEELSELVARLAQRLQEQGQERIDQAQASCNAACAQMSGELDSAHRQISGLQDRLTELQNKVESQAAALACVEQALHAEQTENARLNQANADQQARLADKDARIRSLEQKHEHAREALEHYRNAIKEQREQEQRRHEGQVQQLQMELRQSQQGIMLAQEDITRLNRDNERLLAENRTTLRDLKAHSAQLDKAIHESGALAQQQQHAQTQCALLEERLRAAQGEAAHLKQAIVDGQQQNRVLELLLARKEIALEALQTAATPEPAKTARPARPRAKPKG